MQAVILAGGLGTRLRPITDYVPKPLVPLDNVPILEWQVRYLKRFGIDDVTVCTGYRTGQIEEFLRSRSSFGIRMRVSAEQEPLGTAGAIKKAGGHIRDESFLVLNGDVITDIDLDVMTGRTNSVSAIELRTRFGTIDVVADDDDGGGRIKSFHEKKPISGVWMNAGIYHLSSDVVGMLPSKGDIEKTAFPRMAGGGDLHAVKFPGARWFSIDSHKDIEECSLAVGSIVGGA